MKINYSEFDMLSDCYKKLLNSKKFNKIALEVPYMTRCIDMVLVDKQNQLISIEFKINNWRKALEQARDHSLGADWSYICLPKRKITDNMLSEFENLGIGLFFYSNIEEYPLELIIQPRENNNRWNIWRNSLMEKVSILSTN
jgi:hypothetical protein